MRTFKGVDPLFDQYLELYEILKGSRMGDIGIGFKKQNLPVIGRCTFYIGGYKEISVDPEYWSLANDMQRTSLLFHELGHCDLGRMHESGDLSDGTKKSIMNYYLIGWDSKEMEDYYFWELFNK